MPGGLVASAMLRFQGEELVEVRAARAGDGPWLSGLLIPGLVNAHTHLELTSLGLIPGGSGLPAWVEAQAFARVGHEVGLEAARDGAAMLVQAGTAGVSDICGERSTAEVLVRAGLSGIAQVELLGRDEHRELQGIARAQALGRVVSSDRARVVERASPHAPVSTSLALARSTFASAVGAPASVHLAEGPDERVFLTEHAGRWADLLDQLGVAWRNREAVVGGPVDWLRAAGGLGSHALLVHGVDLRGPELSEIAQSGASLCLCVRSNLHIGGAAPDLAAVLSSGIRVALGTDSLASCEDLDVLGELPTLSRLAPEVPVERWLRAATEDGAAALGLCGLGSFSPGARPGLVHLDAALSDLRRRSPERRWLLRPGRPAPVPQEAS